jgi:hypothetical protein
MGLVLGHLSPPDVCAARLVCREWCASLSARLLLLRPRRLHAERAAARFSGIRALELKQCCRLGDGALAGLAEALPMLCTLSLESCDAVTDDAMPELRRLGHLTSLNLRNCVKVGVGM